MAIVQQLLVNYLANQLSGYIEKAKVVINNKTIDFEVYKTTIDGAKIRKFIYVVEETGLITKASLVDSNGNFLAIKPVNIEKFEDGIMIVFEFNLDIQEV